MTPLRPVAIFLEPERNDGKNGASPLTAVSGPQTTFSNQGEEAMAGGKSSEVMLGWGTGSLVVLWVSHLGVNGPGYWWPQL